MTGYDSLRLFLTVVNHGSFSRAAINLAMTQSTVSKQVQRLEQELGTLLFYRNGRGARLTEEGTRFAEVARSVFTQLDRIKTELNDEAPSLQGRVTLGLPPSLGASLSVPLTLRFKERFPNADLRIIDAFSGNLLEMLEIGKLDTAILYNARISSTMLVDPFFSQRLYLIESGLTLPVGSPAHIGELGKGSFVLSSSNNGLRRAVDEAVAAEGIEIKIYAELDSLNGLIRMVETGKVRCILPFGAVHREVGEGRVRARPFSGPGLNALLVSAMPHDRPVRRLVKELQQLLRVQLAASIADNVVTGTALR